MAMQKRLRELAEKYISNMEAAKAQLNSVKSAVSKEFQNYLADSKYYYSVKDYLTSIICASYAEGLIDGSHLVKGTKMNWVATNKKVLVVGTWDLIHAGHIKFLWYAKRFGRLYVIVSRDINVQKSKGRPPIIPERQRKEVLENLKPVDFVVLGDKEDFLKPVEKIKPDLIILGPDEQYSVKKLRKELKKRGLSTVVMRLPSRFSDYPLSSTTQIINRVLEIGHPNPK
jgi:FAD synthetase